MDNNKIFFVYKPLVGNKIEVNFRKEHENGNFVWRKKIFTNNKDCKKFVNELKESGYVTATLQTIFDCLD